MLAVFRKIICVQTCLFFICAAALATDCRAQQVIPLLMGEKPATNKNTPALRPRTAAVLTYLEREMDVKFEIRHYPRRRLMQNLKNGEGLAFGISKNTERSAYLRFSVPVYVSYVWLVTRSDARFEFSSMQDLKGKTIGVVAGSGYNDEFDQVKNVLFKIEEDPGDTVVRMKKLYMHRMDAQLFSSNFTSAEEAEVEFNTKADKYAPDLVQKSGVRLSVLHKPFMLDEIYFAVAADHDDGWIDRINAAIERGKKNGEFDRIIAATAK